MSLQAYGRNTLIYSALSNRMTWCTHFFQRIITGSPHFFQRIAGVRRAEQERNRADDAEAQVREILSVPEIKQFWEMILRQKAFLEEMHQRIAKAVKALYDFALNRDLIFSKEAEVSIGNGIIAEQS